MRAVPVCQHCGGDMRKTVISSGNCSGIAVALIVFCAGIMLTLLLPVVGWVCGPIISLAALFMGGKRQAVWKCRDCGYFFERA
jgi:hypothetical protein